MPLLFLGDHVLEGKEAMHRTQHDSTASKVIWGSVLSIQYANEQ